MSRSQSLKLDPSELWRLYPHTFAKRASRGRWVPYDYLARISRAIAKAVRAGRGRIIVSLPPRHGKSELISKWVPTWRLDDDPTARVMLASYEADFAARWGRHVRAFFEQQDLSRTKISTDSSAADRWETTLGGGMNTAGVGGAFTGKGGDLLLVDDPIKNWEEAQSAKHREKIWEWFLSTFYTRAEPGATIVVLMTRWHERDLAGRLLTEHSDTWHEINLMATSEGDGLGTPLCPERYTQADLLGIRKSLGPMMYGALYDQRPRPLEGGVFKKNWFRYWLPNTLPDTFDEIIQSWDLPFDNATDASSYVAGQVWGRKGADRYLLHEYHEQTDYPGMKAAVRNMTAAYPLARTKVVENKASGAPLIKDLKSEISGLVAWNPKGSKFARATACSGEVESGNVYLPHPSIAPWVRDALEELCAFPKGKFNDRVDAMTQALLRFTLNPSAKGSISLGSITRAAPVGGMR